MNRNNPQPRVPTLKDLYGPKESSLPWEEHQAEIVRFWTDSGDCWGFLFHHVYGTYYSAKERRLLIDWPLGTIVVTGPEDVRVLRPVFEPSRYTPQGRRQRYSLGQDASKFRRPGREGRGASHSRNWEWGLVALRQYLPH